MHKYALHIVSSPISQSRSLSQTTDISKSISGPKKITFIYQGPGIQSFLKVKVILTLRCEISKVVFYTLY